MRFTYFLCLLGLLDELLGGAGRVVVRLVAEVASRSRGAVGVGLLVAVRCAVEAFAVVGGVVGGVRAWPLLLDGDGARQSAKLREWLTGTCPRQDLPGRCPRQRRRRACCAQPPCMPGCRSTRGCVRCKFRWGLGGHYLWLLVWWMSLTWPNWEK